MPQSDMCNATLYLYAWCKHPSSLLNYIVLGPECVTGGTEADFYQHLFYPNKNGQQGFFSHFSWLQKCQGKASFHDTFINLVRLRSHDAINFMPFDKGIIISSNSNVHAAPTFQVLVLSDLTQVNRDLPLPFSIIWFEFVVSREAILVSCLLFHHQKW